MANRRASGSGVAGSLTVAPGGTNNDAIIGSTTATATFSLSYYSNYAVYRWGNGTGTLVVTTAGYADVLLAGGGGAGDGPDRVGGASGGAGSVIEMRVWMPTGTYAVYCGSGGAFDAGGGQETYLRKVPTSRYFASEIFRLSAPGGGGGFSQNTPGTLDTGGDSGDGYIHNNGAGGTVGTGAGAGGVGAIGGYAGTAGTAGVWSSITGTALQYGVCGGGASGTPGTSGYGGSFGGGSAGTSGAVIVRVRV